MAPSPSFIALVLEEMALTLEKKQLESYYFALSLELKAALTEEEKTAVFTQLRGECDRLRRLAKQQRVGMAADLLDRSDGDEGSDD